MTVRYEIPRKWIRYDSHAVQHVLVEAKAAVMALTQMPYQRSWADELQVVQLKREVAGTSRIEGADFTEKELEAALSLVPGDLETRSQKQAAAAVGAYRWIAGLPQARPVDGDLIREVHARIVRGCDDDHCPPGQLRGEDQNVTFGSPRHRGAEGGSECQEALDQLVSALGAEFQEHDPLVQALALHYHLAAMHPFLDGNGRTARAVEALMLQRVGLRDTLFIAMSNYYYEEKTAYLDALNQTRAGNHDLTPFLVLGLRGIGIQCRRLMQEIRVQIQKALYKNTVRDLFGRLESPRKRVMTERQVKVAFLLLDEGSMLLSRLYDRVAGFYDVSDVSRAMLRDLNYLLGLEAITANASSDGRETVIAPNLNWPTQITETEFFRRAKELPKGKLHGFLST